MTISSVGVFNWRAFGILEDTTELKNEPALMNVKADVAHWPSRCSGYTIRVCISNYVTFDHFTILVFNAFVGLEHGFQM